MFLRIYFMHRRVVGEPGFPTNIELISIIQVGLDISRDFLKIP